MDEDTMLDALIEGKPLWDISTLPGLQHHMMEEARNRIKIEWQAHMDDETASHLHTGVLLGALNLITGLLGDWEKFNDAH